MCDYSLEVRRARLWPWSKNIIQHKTAIFRQVNIDCPHAHHDALEFPDGEIVLLTYLMEGQQGTVFQLPAAAVGSKAPERAAYVDGQPAARRRGFDQALTIGTRECTALIIWPCVSASIRSASSAS